MARIRTIKPEFSEDHRLARELTRDERLFYILLWNQADDEGRFQAHPRRVLGACFPYDEDLSAEDIELWMQQLEKTDRLVRYVVDGEPYAFLTKFPAHQRINRPTPSRLPAPPNGQTPPSGPPDKGSLRDHGGLTEDSIPHARAPELELEEEVDLEKEEEVEVAGGQADRPASVENFVDNIIRAANRGMLDNPLIGDACHPIPVSHGSRQVVSDWLHAGVPAEVAESIAYQRAKEYRPNDRRRQPTTMRYFDAAVREAFDREQARLARPKPGTEASAVSGELPQERRSRSTTSGLQPVAAEPEDTPPPIDLEAERVKRWTEENQEQAERIRKAVGVRALKEGPKGERALLAWVNAQFRQRVLEIINGKTADGRRNQGADSPPGRRANG